VVGPGGGSSYAREGHLGPLEMLLFLVLGDDTWMFDLNRILLCCPGWPGTSGLK
jgi:hypothetical protein